MHRHAFWLLLILMIALSCSETTPQPDGDLDTHTDVAQDSDLESEIDGDVNTDADVDIEKDTDLEPDGDLDSEADEELEAEWEFDRDDYAPVNGWIILDSNPDAVRETIEAAAEYGVNHIQLSHDLIMNIDEVLGDNPTVNIETLNLGISLAHENGMKAYIWAHEFSPTTISVCYDPADDIWERRANAYRQALALLPDLDGIILMFGSAPTPPWYTFCSCDWCADNYDGTPLDSPPHDERIRMVVEHVGDVIVNELGLDLFIRTFVHEPAELDFHSQGLSNVKGVAFTGMHKGPVQDWQPYNPHHANTGHIGPHPGVLELDVAGEYWGRSILPFAAPGYFRYRYLHAYRNRGIGSVLRVQRGSDHTLGTPNEINILTLNTLLNDPSTSLDSIWNTFLQARYNVAPEAAKQSDLRRILEDSFEIRLKSHYILGIWALDKSSNFPTSASYDQFTDRGEMPKWDADWQERWDMLDKPSADTVRWVWQEASEAVELGSAALESMPGLEDTLSESDYLDLSTRVTHQYHAARAWRAMKTWIVAKRAYGRHPEDSNLPGWMQTMLTDLASIQSDMSTAGLDNVGLARPSDIGVFLGNATPLTPNAEALPIGPAMISHIQIDTLSATGASCRFTPHIAGHVYLDYGTEIPDYGETLDLGERPAETEISANIDTLPPADRIVVRVRIVTQDTTWLSGDKWLFPPFNP
jgi:hypothetical protein